MSEIINWINIRGLKDEEYLGNLCKKNHEYLDTGKSVRCKPTDRPNGKCVCCRKESRDKSYRNNLQTKKNYYEINKDYISRTRKEKYKINMLNDDFRQKRNEYKAMQRRQKGMIPREELSLQSALKNIGLPSVIDLIQKQIKENKVFDQNKHQKIKYRTNLEFNIYVKLKRGMQRAKDRGLPYEKIDVKKIINKIYSYNKCCAYCGTKLNLLIANKDNSLEMDHIVSFQNKGSHTFDNLIPSCKKCNHSKRADKLEDWYKNQVFFKKEILERIKQ